MRGVPSTYYDVAGHCPQCAADGHIYMLFQNDCINLNMLLGVRTCASVGGYLYVTYVPPL